MEPRALGRWAVGGLLLVGVALSLAYIRQRGRTGPGGDLADAPAVLSSRGTRIRVEVLNTTGTRGLARRATFALREAGFDVVRFGSDDGGPRDSTLVIDRSGHREWAERVARALGAPQVESQPDSSRFLDVTVLLGADWRPPTKPFYP